MDIISSLQAALDDAKMLNNANHGQLIQQALTSLMANYGELLVAQIRDKALKLGWSEEELSGNSIFPSTRSLKQGLYAGDNIVLVEEEVIAVQKISGQIHLRKKKPWQKLSSHVEKVIKSLSQN